MRHDAEKEETRNDTQVFDSRISREEITSVLHSFIITLIRY
jgi:hypothetical protein